MFFIFYLLFERLELLLEGEDVDLDELLDEDDEARLLLPLDEDDARVLLLEGEAERL